MRKIDDVYIKGPVLVPDQSDWDGDIVTAGDIQRAAYTFLETYRVVDVQHAFKKIAEPVESYIAPEPTSFNNLDYPAGTWFLTSRIVDDKVKEAVLNGELKGYSVGALPEKDYEQLKRPLPLIAKKKTFKDVDKWFPFAVSIVDYPNVPNAIFKVFMLEDVIKKNREIEEEDQEGVINMSEDKNALAVVVDKLVDALIKKEDPLEVKQETGEVTETVSLEDLKEKVETIEKNNNSIRSQLQKILDSIDRKEETPPEPDGTEEEEDEEDEEDKATETTEIKTEPEEEVITKSIPSDASTNTNQDLNTMLGLKRDGRPVKYSWEK